jgi:TfoX/Sxy family transcriptional regulator of competence genes
MASDPEFVNFVADQISDVGVVTSKKMFGEYLIYVNQKPIVLVCDNTAFVKILDCVRPLLEPASGVPAEKGFPYEGAKEHYIVDVDNRELLTSVVRELEKVIPIPKKKQKNGK